MLVNFIWNTKTAKVKSETMIGDFGDAGLKLPGMYSVHTTQKDYWIINLLNDSYRKWKNLTLKLLNIDTPLLSHKLPPEMRKQASTLFYQHVLDGWYKYISVAVLTKSEVLDEYLCFNKHIRINSTYIYTNHRINERIFHIKVKDVMENNTFISYINFKEKLGWNIDHMYYLGLKKSIPREWINGVEKATNVVGTKKHDQDLLNRLESQKIY